MKYKTIAYEVSDELAFVYLNRPAELNAIDSRMRTDLVDAFGVAREDDAVKAIVLASRAEDVFSVGSDVPELRKALADHSDAAALVELRRQLALSDPWDTLASQPKPTVAALHGQTLSAGLELALICDIRVASDDASFGFPEVRMGLIPMHGGTQRLARIAGRGKALEMILSGEPIDAAEAYRVELVSKVVPRKELLSTATDIARRLAASAPIAIEYAREAVVSGLDLSFEQGLHLEMDLYALLQTTADRAEGLRSFREKRAPKFEGR